MNTRHYFLCPVTHFAGKNLYRSDLTYEQIRRFLPVAPNVQHFDDRIPLQTIPRWNDATSYVLLQSVEVEGYKVERSRFITHRIENQEREKNSGVDQRH